MSLFKVMDSAAHSDLSRVKRLAVFAGLLMMAVFLYGCATVMYPGSPSISFEKDPDVLKGDSDAKASNNGSTPVKPASAEFNLNRGATKDERNKFITNRLAMIDLQYVKWVREVTAGTQHLGVVGDPVANSASLASSAAGGGVAKSVLSGISSGVGFAKTNAEAHYFYNQIVAALVATMNAQRKEVLQRILNGMTNELDKYNFAQAIIDLDDYYQAGTFNTAFNVMQKNAKENEDRTNIKIETFKISFHDEIEASEAIKKVIANIEINEVSF